jgi:hypothetical protein
MTDFGALFENLANLLQKQANTEMNQNRCTKALQDLVRHKGRFDGQNITLYLREYVAEMEMHRLSEKEMVTNFEFTVVPEMRSKIQALTKQGGVQLEDWRVFEQKLKIEFFGEDEDRVTKRSFLEWVSKRPGDDLSPHGLLREFSTKFFELSPMEKVALEPRKVELFIEAATEEFAEKLLMFLVDKTTECGISNDWSKVEDYVMVLTRQMRARGKLKVNPSEPKIPSYRPPPISITKRASTTPTITSTTNAQGPDSAIEELVRGMRDLKVEMAELRKAPTIIAKGQERPMSSDFVRRCIWCDDPAHSRNACEDLSKAISAGTVHFHEGKLHLSETGALLKANFGKGGMQALIRAPRPTTMAATVFMPHSCVGQADQPKASIPTPQEGLKRGAEMIRQKTGWDDPVEIGCIQAYLKGAKSVHFSDAVVEAKRGRDEIGGFDPEETTRASRAAKKKPQVESQEASSDIEIEALLKDASKLKETNAKPKSKPSSYKLLSDIESNTNLKEILEERILDSKIEFSLREVLGIAKRDFHELIIDVIKRKRQMTTEAAVVGALDTIITLEETQELERILNKSTPEFEAIVSLGNIVDGEKNGFSKRHWAKSTATTDIYLGNISMPISALVDSGSEINIVSRAIYEKEKWPIDTGHGWILRAANNSRGDLYGACPSVMTRIGDVTIEQNFFVQNDAPFPIILGQPYITASRMETKVMNDGSHYARIRSPDGLRSVQFLIVQAMHERNRTKLREERVDTCNHCESEDLN